MGNYTITKHSTTGPLWWESTCNRWIPLKNSKKEVFIPKSEPHITTSYGILNSIGQEGLFQYEDAI